uniref:PRKCSH_1 domain-containing protein n=1 Tax=Steinernema glaseri TaxID=37863 RepID=A0A1I7Z8D2_9BILA
MICRVFRFICCLLTCLPLLIAIGMLVIIVGEEVFMWLKVESSAKDFEAVFAKARLDIELNPVAGPYGHWVYGVIPGNHTDWYKNDRVFLAEYKYDADENERRLREGVVKKAINDALQDKIRLAEDNDMKLIGDWMGNYDFKRCEDTVTVSCLPAFKNVHFEKMHEYMVAENHRLIACVAPTSYKRHLETLMCYLSDPVEFRKQNKRVVVERERKFGSGNLSDFPKIQLTCSQDLILLGLERSFQNDHLNQCYELQNANFTSAMPLQASLSHAPFHLHKNGLLCF